MARYILLGLRGGDEVKLHRAVKLAAVPQGCHLWEWIIAAMRAELTSMPQPPEALEVHQETLTSGG